VTEVAITTGGGRRRGDGHDYHVVVGKRPTNNPPQAGGTMARSWWPDSRCGMVVRFGRWRQDLDARLGGVTRAVEAMWSRCQAWWIAAVVQPSWWVVCSRYAWYHGASGVT
jgi:hypothetical protein